MSDSDGMPADILRAKGYPGCFADLTCGVPQGILEPEAVENDMIPLYGVEWTKYLAHHTNFFCIDRQIFEQLRALLLNLDHLSAVYEKSQEGVSAAFCDCHKAFSWHD